MDYDIHNILELLEHYNRTYNIFDCSLIHRNSQSNCHTGLLLCAMHASCMLCAYKEHIIDQGFIQSVPTVTSLTANRQVDG